MSPAFRWALLGAVAVVAAELAFVLRYLVAVKVLLAGACL